MKLVPILLETADPTNDETRIFCNSKNTKKLFNRKYNVAQDTLHPIFYNIYLINPEEEIKINEWCIDIWNEDILQMDKATKDMLEAEMLHNPHAKIIASTDRNITLCRNSDHEEKCDCVKVLQLSEQAISLLIDYYNKNGCMPEFVDVEEKEGLSKPLHEALHDSKPLSFMKFIKLNSQGTVDISISDSRILSIPDLREELEMLILQNEDDFDRGKGKYILKAWIEENLK